jgi:hypothetical protein
MYSAVCLYSILLWQMRTDYSCQEKSMIYFIFYAQ